MDCFCGQKKEIGKNIAELFKGFEIRECQECKQLYSYPPPVMKTIEAEVYQEFNSRHEAISEFDMNYARLNIHLLNGKNVLSKRFLDFGCGNGATLKAAKELGMKSEGIEINKNMAEYVRKQGFLVHASLNEVKEEKFDVVNISAVLEHLPAEEDILEELKKVIHVKTKVLINVPNYGSFARRFFGKYWMGYRRYEHLWYFTPETIQYLINKKGYKIEIIEQYPMGAGIDRHGSFVYESAGYLLDGQAFGIRIINAIIHCIDKMTGKNIGKFIRTRGPKKCGDQIFIVCSLLG